MVRTGTWSNSASLRRSSAPHLSRSIWMENSLAARIGATMPFNHAAGCHVSGLRIPAMENREVSGLMAGIASSGIGGMATAVTRYAVAGMDPVQVTFFRFGIAFTLLCPLALVLRKAWPCRSDWAAAASLGIMFYGGFFVVFAYALTLTTAARGALGIATLPVVTMLIAAAMRREPMTLRKSTGVLIASGGVAFALASGLEVAPEGAWRGDLTMIVAIGSMALYTILSRPFIERSSSLGYACFGMGAGAAFMGVIIAGAQGFDVVRGLSTAQWASMLFL